MIAFNLIMMMSFCLYDVLDPNDFHCMDRSVNHTILSFQSKM